MSVNIYDGTNLTPIAGKTVPMPYTPAPQSMIGDAWVSGHAYAVRDYCIDGNVLYKCKTAHTSSASYRPPYASYWDAVSVSDEINTKCSLYVQNSTITGETTEIAFPSGLTMKNALLQNVFIKYSSRWYTPEGLAHYKAAGTTGGYAVVYPSANNNTSNKTIIQLISGDYSRFIGCEVRIVFLVASTDFLPSAL